MTCGATLSYQAESTNILSIVLVDEDGDPLNDASAEVTLYHEDKSTIVDGETWPLPLNYVNLSDGEYTVTVTDELDVDVNETLKAKISVIGADLHKGTFWRDVVVVEG